MAGQIGCQARQFIQFPNSLACPLKAESCGGGSREFSRGPIKARKLQQNHHLMQRVAIKRKKNIYLIIVVWFSAWKTSSGISATTVHSSQLFVEVMTCVRAISWENKMLWLIPEEAIISAWRASFKKWSKISRRSCCRKKRGERLTWVANGRRIMASRLPSYKPAQLYAFVGLWLLNTLMSQPSANFSYIRIINHLYPAFNGNDGGMAGFFWHRRFQKKRALSPKQAECGIFGVFWAIKRVKTTGSVW